MIRNNFRRLCLLCLAAIHLWLPAATPGAAEQFLAAIDAGHSKANPGATSATGTGEYEFNASLARLLLAKAPPSGRVQLSLINKGGDDMPLEDRAKTAGTLGADLLLSVHHDSVLPEYLTPWVHNGRDLFHCDLFQGFAIFYSEKNNDRGRSLAFAKLLGAALVEHNFTPSQHHAEMMTGEGKAVVDARIGVFRYDALSVLRNAQMPAVLLECGFIVNREEEKRLRDDAYKSGIAAAILKSMEIFSETESR